MQKQIDKDKTICHATSLIQQINAPICKEFLRTFYISEGS